MTVGTEILPARAEARVPVSFGSRGIQIETMDELARFAKLVASTPFAPPAFKTPESIAVCIQYGLEVGLSPMQSLQNVALINGKPAVYGDAMLALVRASGKLEWIVESLEGEGEKREAICTVKRKDSPGARTTTFSMADARRAGLLGKGGPWTQYPDRMLTFRARGFNLRDEFGEVLKGIVSAEEAEDYAPAKVAVTDGSFRRVSAVEPGARADALAQELKGNGGEAAPAAIPMTTSRFLDDPPTEPKKRRGRPAKAKEEIVPYTDAEMRAGLDVAAGGTEQGDAWEPAPEEAALILEAEQAEAE